MTAEYERAGQLGRLSNKGIGKPVYPTPDENKARLERQGNEAQRRGTLQLPSQTYSECSLNEGEQLTEIKLASGRKVEVRNLVDHGDGTAQGEVWQTGMGYLPCSLNLYTPENHSQWLAAKQAYENKINALEEEQQAQESRWTAPEWNKELPTLKNIQTRLKYEIGYFLSMFEPD